MAEKTLSTRIIHKHDVESNWLLATNFTPKQGELIVYDIDSNYSYERLKIGDGVQNVNALPFVIDAQHKSEVFFYASEINFVDQNTYVTLDDYNLVPTNKQINVGDFIISNSKVYKTVEVESGAPTGEYSIKITYMLDIDLSGSNNIFYAPGISTTATRQGDVGFARAEIIPSDKEIKIGDIVIANSQVYQVVYLGKNILADIEADCLFNIDNTIPNFATIDGSTLKMQRTDGATTTNLFEVELPSTPVDDTLTESGKAADAKATGDAILNLNTLVGDTAVSEQILSAIDDTLSKSDSAADAWVVGDRFHNIDTRLGVIEGRRNVFYASRMSIDGTTKGEVRFDRDAMVPSDTLVEVGDLVIINSRVYQVVYVTVNVDFVIEADFLFEIDKTIPNSATINGLALKMQRTDGTTTTDLFEVEILDDTLTKIDKAASAWVVGDAISGLNTLVGDTPVSEQIDIAINEATADDFGIYVQASEPTEAVAGDIWIDTINDPSYIPPTLPEITEADNGKVLMVVNGKLQLVNLNLTTDANGVLSI